MSKYSIKNLTGKKLPTKILKQYYNDSKTEIAAKSGDYPNFDFTDLDFIFNTACKNRDLFASINISKPQTPEIYIKRWILSYCEAIKNPPSKRIASPKKSCDDPLVEAVIMQIQGVTKSVAEDQVRTHNMFMATENILGYLLEEYIAEKIRPYKWIWCAGETLRAIDFCNENGTVLLQIKNKYNSENSSSVTVREGTSIKKWHRLGVSHTDGENAPVFKWDKLNNIINQNIPKGMNELELKEEDFEIFIKKVITANPNIIKEK